ncbi:MAG TPA: hypothetical protein V6D46_06535, partial [Coleofasciculaceae cyanobacterium]
GTDDTPQTGNSLIDCQSKIELMALANNEGGMRIECISSAPIASIVATNTTSYVRLNELTLVVLVETICSELL